MPDPIELSTNSNNEASAPEHPLASDNIPGFYEHIEEMQKSEQNQDNHLPPQENTSVESSNQTPESISEAQAFQSKAKDILLETPKQAKDVHGEWVQYTQDDKRIFNQAIRLYDKTMRHMDNPKFLSHALEDGDVWLFHLQDPETGDLSKYGQVAITLKDRKGQPEIEHLFSIEKYNIEDALMPTVIEKVESIPGEISPYVKQDINRYKHHGALHAKVQNGEKLTPKEEKYLHRSSSLVGFYGGLDSALEHGADLKLIISEINPKSLARCLDTFTAHGISIGKVVSEKPQLITRNLDDLLAQGVTMDMLVPELNHGLITRNLDMLITHGADVKAMTFKLRPQEIADNLETLLDNGGDIDFITSRLKPDTTLANLDLLVSSGANIDIDKLVSELRPKEIGDDIEKLIAHGANIDNLVSSISNYDIAKNLDLLVSNGAHIDIDELVADLSSETYGVSKIVRLFDTLISHGADIDLDDLMTKLSPFEIWLDFKTLLSHGVKVDTIVAKMEPKYIAKEFDTLVANGASPEDLIGRIKSSDETLLELIHHD